jgi:hypothetical protein
LRGSRVVSLFCRSIQIVSRGIQPRLHGFIQTGLPYAKDADFGLFRSVDVARSTKEFCNVSFRSVPCISGRLVFFSTSSALSEWGDPIQNSGEHIAILPQIRNSGHIYRGCHLLNLALGDAFKDSHGLVNVNRDVSGLATGLRKRLFREWLEKRCSHLFTDKVMSRIHSLFIFRNESRRHQPNRTRHSTWSFCLWRAAWAFIHIKLWIWKHKNAFLHARTKAYEVWGSNDRTWCERIWWVWTLTNR